MLQGISNCAEDQFADQPQRLRKPEVFELRSIFFFLTVNPALPVNQKEKQEWATDMKCTRWCLSKNNFN